MVTILRTNTYTGQEQDEFGGLIYYNARWYDPEIGRFISEDPAAANPNDPLTINRYIYCRNNPLIYTDPTGEIFGIDDFVFIAICALVAGVGNTIDAMTNPKNQWYGGNYNDAFWHGFGQGAAAGSAVVAMAGIPDAIAKIGKALSGVEGWTLDWITTFSKSSYDNLSPIVKDVVKYGDMLISNKGSTNQFLTKWAGSVNPFTNDYLKEFYDITVGNAYDMYTGQTRDIYKLYFTSATQVWAGKYIDASIPLTETDEEDTNPLGKKNINNFLKGTFNDAASSLINNGRISGSSVIGAGFSAANPLIISISVGTKEYPVFYESIPPDLRL